MSHFQVSRDLIESLSSLSRLGRGLERRGTGSLSSSVDCCYLVKFIKLNRTQSVCTREKEKERKGFLLLLFEKNELPPKNKKKTLLPGYKTGVKFVHLPPRKPLENIRKSVYKRTTYKRFTQLHLSNWPIRNYSSIQFLLQTCFRPLLQTLSGNTLSVGTKNIQVSLLRQSIQVQDFYCPVSHNLSGNR
jgi:hypothetical protein